MDPGQIGQGAAAVYGAVKASKGIGRLLGPAADEFAEALRRWTSYRVGNAQRIVRVAEAKSDTHQPGLVSQRVALQLLEEGSYSDDEIVVEYLGGVLASARTPDGKDDRAVPWASLISRLSRDQLRLHYVLYTLLRHNLPDLQHEYWRMNTICEQQIYVPWSALVRAMEWNDVDDARLRCDDAILGLDREGLIGGFSIAKREPLAVDTGRAVPSRGLVFQGSSSGCGLYLWGHGKGTQQVEAFADPAQEFALTEATVDVPFAEACNLDTLPVRSP